MNGFDSGAPPISVLQLKDLEFTSGFALSFASSVVTPDFPEREITWFPSKLVSTFEEV